MRQITLKERRIIEYLNTQEKPVNSDKIGDNVSGFDQDVFIVLKADGFVKISTVKFRWMYEITDEGREALK